MSRAALRAYVAAMRWEDVPPKVRHQAKRSVMNLFAVALAGCRTDPIEIALSSLQEFSGGKQATLIGRAERIDALSAAFLNAAAANVHDFCDTHVATVIHPTAPVAPALLALAELRKVSGPELLLGFILGNEVQARIGLAISPKHYDKGWHITSTCGVFGAAAGAGKLLSLDEHKLVSALGTASTQSAGLCECLGWPAKSVSVGNAARNGLWSALLAAKGFDGPAEPLAGRQGFYNALGDKPDLSRVTDGLGESWEIMATSYKPYPCGFVIHPVLDCVLDWRHAHPQAEVDARGGARQSAAGAPHRPSRCRDRTGVAGERAACCRGRPGVRPGRRRSVHRCLRQRSAVLALRRTVEVVRDESFSTIAAAVEITAGGEVHRLSQTAARGSDTNPLSDADLEQKLRTSAAALNPRHDIQPLIDAVWALEASADVSGLAALAGKA